MKIHIVSIPRRTSTGLSEWTNDNGVSMKKTKMGTCKDYIMALYNPKVGGLDTGLNEPWIEAESGLVKVDSFGKPLTLQDKLEEKWGLPTGFLTNKVFRPNDSYDPAKMTYYQTKMWGLQDGTTILDLANMDDELGYYVMLKSPLVANSETEWRSHKWPRAQFYIARANESDEIIYARNELKAKAMGTLNNIEITTIDRRKMASLLELISSKSVANDKLVYNALYSFIDRGDSQNQNIQKFIALGNLLNTGPGREEFEARYVLKQAIDYKVIYERQGSYTWIRPQGNLVIGDRYEDAIAFILSPKKAPEVEDILAAIKEKSI